MDVMDAIRTRRTVRRLSSQPVNDELIDAVLEAGRWAPSWANSQCWRLVVVRDPMVKSRLADAVRQGNRSTDAVRNAPVVIVACAEMGKAGFYRGEMSTDKGDWFMFDVALAMENINLAAQELGLGMVHVGLMDAKKMEQVLEVPPGVKVVELAPLGYPDEPPRVPPRKELAEIAFYDKYGKTKA